MDINCMGKKMKKTCVLKNLPTVTNAHSPLLIPVPLAAPLVLLEEPAPPVDVVALYNFGKPETETAYRWS